MKRILLVTAFILIALLSASIGHRLGYRQGQRLAAQSPEASGHRAAPETIARVPSPDPAVPSSMEFPRPAEAPRPLPASPSPAPAPSEVNALGSVLSEGAKARFSLGPNPTAPAPTGDRARYPGISILEENLGINETQVLRMCEWLKRRDEAYGLLSQIKDPTVHAAQGQVLKDYYESLFRSELTPEQQVKYDELKEKGSFSFRGPPTLEQ